MRKAMCTLKNKTKQKQKPASLQSPQVWRVVRGQGQDQADSRKDFISLGAWEPALPGSRHTQRTLALRVVFQENKSLL